MTRSNAVRTSTAQARQMRTIHPFATGKGRFFRPRQSLRLRLSCALTVLVCLAPFAIPAAPVAPRPSSITVISDDNYPPFIFRDARGDLQGLLIDEWNLWKRKTGIDVRLLATDWEKAQQWMADGRGDIIDTMFFNERRAKMYDFSKPYRKIDVPVFVHRSIRDIHSVASLRGFWVGVKKGDACIDILAAEGITSLHPYDSYEKVVAAAARRDLPVFAIDRPAARHYLNQLGLRDDYTEAFVLYSGELHRAVRKGNRTLLAVVEEGFARISPAERRQLDTHWLGASPGRRVDYRQVLLIVGFLGVFGILAAALGVFAMLLRRKVRQKTATLVRINEQLRQEIAERSSAETKLRESEERFRALSENAPDIIYTLSLDGAFTYVNPAWSRILGHREDEVMGRYFTDFAKESDRRMFRRHFRSVRDEGKTVNNLIAAMLSRDGRERTFNMNSAPNRDAGGRIVRIVGSMKDITELQEMEIQLNQASKLEAIGTLAGGIAHDFNNLLVGIQGSASMMKRDVPPSHPHYERLEHIEEHVRSGSELTRQLLGFARNGRRDAQPVDLNEIIRKTASMFGRTRKELLIRTRLEPEIWSVEADRGQMEQVFMNLFVNAWQAMPAGGEIAVETRNEDPAPDPVHGNGRLQRAVRVSVADTGVGMDEKTRQRIFDPFFTTKASGGGAGLGLAVVYGIVRGHEGRITVASEPGRGTVFTIHLPASGKAVPAEQTASDAILTGTETILLVDDEKTVLEVSKELLESLGYRVVAAAGGQDALAAYAAQSGAIDLVILDMIMPGLSGGETFDLLRERDPDVRVLLASGYSSDGMAQDILRRGCRGFLQKPFRFEQLSQAVRKALDS